MLEYNLQTVFYHFKTDFKNFFKNKQIIAQPQKKEKLWVKDLDTGMLAIHHFTKSKDLEKQYHEDFLPIMLKRYYFVKKIMQKAKHILLVSRRNDTQEDLILFLKDMHTLFPTKITLINIRSSAERENYTEKIINKDLRFIEYQFNDVNPQRIDHWTGNKEKWQAILADIKLSLPIKIKSLFRRRNIKWVR